MKIINVLFVLSIVAFAIFANAKSPSLSVEEYLSRQKSVYYLGQRTMINYDQKLDVIFTRTQKKEFPLFAEAQDFTKARFESLLAWEFSEKHMHEMQERYATVLKYAHTNGSPYQKRAKSVLAKAKSWIANEWKNGDKSFVIYLTQALGDTTLTNSYKLTEKEHNEASVISKYLLQSRIKTIDDGAIESEWNSFSTNRKNEFEEEFVFENNSFSLIKVLDPLEPSPGPNGHVTGNRFPTGKWAMTFDDGPHATLTKAMINNLVTNNVHGTFFWQTQNVLRLPEFPRTKSTIYSRALHSYTHKKLTEQSSSGLNKEINLAAQDFAKVVGEKPTMFRCPYGSCGKNNSTVRKMIAAQNMLHIAWNVDTNPDSIFARAKKQIDSLGRGIVLFHDIQPQTVSASDKVIKYLKSKYKIEPLNKLIEEARGKPYHTP
jgi:peptidoglycan/xylan/chitin deacetylase (PgdA/CDA1 family)